MSDAMSIGTAEESQDQHRRHTVTIAVNNKPVPIEGPRVTGLEIKQAAIAAGVQIELDFQLAEVRHGGEQHIVGDDDVVTVTKHSVFVATAGDDNSAPKDHEP